MSKKVAQIIVEVLESAGVKHCYGIVGEARSSGCICATRRPALSPLAARRSY